MKKSLIIVLSLVMVFAFNSMVLASQITGDKDVTLKEVENIIDTENMIEVDSYTNSYTDEKGNFVAEETKVYVDESGWEIEETTQVIIEPNNNIGLYASGTVTKDKTQEIKHNNKSVYRVYIWGKFQYNGSKATVLDYSWSTKILDNSIYEEQKAYAGSGVNILGTASVWVNYNLGSPDGTWKGTVTLNCNKNGN